MIRQLHYGIQSPGPRNIARISVRHNNGVLDGASGTNGTNGTNGANGMNGMNGKKGTNGTNGTNGISNQASEIFQRNRPNEDSFASTTMPESWVRASILIRSYSLSTGNSGVSLGLLQNIVKLLRTDVIPLIPLRGSISASGDLSPLSYVAGVVQGNPNLKAWTGVYGKQRCLLPANEALKTINMSPRDLGPKEGLAITNGTSVSAGVAALALHDAHHLAVLAQVLTAMGVEALTGNVESFDQFIADVRPHPGQLDSSRNIRNFLIGSKLVVSHSMTNLEGGTMRQDRYAVRTSTQWMGPQLEDLCLAHSQIIIDCNSTTDNPLIDVETERILHGGNFQAQAITSAVEKIRLSAQRIGRMLFAQSTEIVNPSLNNGLPPNLVADEPSRSFLMKSVDIGTAAYVSELGFLANPVGSHVHNAELGNQSINSLALISTRYTHMALDVLSQLSAAYLYSLCQALDLRALQAQYLQEFLPIFKLSISTDLSSFFVDVQDVETLSSLLWNNFVKELNSSTSMDSGPRFRAIFTRLTGVAVSTDLMKDTAKLLPSIKCWAKCSSEVALNLFLATRERYACAPDATPVLGQASKRMYKYVRYDLGVPFLKRDTTTGAKAGPFDEAPGCGGTTGSMMTTIYDAIRSGELYVPVMECLRECLL
jgi:phenylalanine ammonia-lyase